MSKLIAISLSWVIMLQSMHINIADVLNISELIEHAQEHKEEFGDNFFQFVAKHYGVDKAEHAQHDDHKNSHENLPFQHSYQLSLVFVLELHKAVYPDFKVFFTQTKISFFHYKSPGSNLFVSGIFQPPRLA